jgi:hypothetical protein
MKPIRLVESQHIISHKRDGTATGLNACFLKKA